MPEYKIFPPIGVARLGSDDDFFISPETPGRGPIEETTGAPVTRFKNADHKRIRKQSWSRLVKPDTAKINRFNAVFDTTDISEYAAKRKLRA